MDTSEIYIKMCEKAEEIQDDWCVKEGDHLIRKYTTGKYSHVRLSRVTLNKKYAPKNWLIIWLPRQDQLQEIFQSWSKLDFKYMLNAFCLAIEKYPVLSYDLDGILKVGPGIGFIPTSMEQLWLAFVMKEKYNKVWDGETWTTLGK